jgi:DNA-binding FadR family transcriptional regulator
LDFQVQKQLSALSGNNILALIMNSMEKLYIRAMTAVYSDEEIRKQARVYIKMVYKATRANEPDAAEAVTRRVMNECRFSMKGEQ